MNETEADRKKRLAEALRANLRRRKAQDRGQRREQAGERPNTPSADRPGQD